ncbi:MAG: aminoacyl-tRNA deacylase [Chloroflexi bacterium]|nr:aminoacyl-tRNA deacylase [Chloroflexota bacterium]
MPPVNNITRFLYAKKIKYTAFETPAEKLGALETARILNIPPERVFKTIVVIRPKAGSGGSSGKPVLAVIPGTRQVDLKLTASALGEKKVSLPTEKEAEGLTGLQAGGISPLALINKCFQVLIDASAQQFDEIHISGGQRGLNVCLPVKDLVELTRARLAPISVPLSDAAEI